jgi:hypothetical protein
MMTGLENECIKMYNRKLECGANFSIEKVELEMKIRKIHKGHHKE